MRSIRLRLLTWLLACVAVVTAAAGAAVYRMALVDADALFDYQLRQLALSLRDQGVAEALADPDENYEIVVQIWDASGLRLYLSHPRIDLPQRAIMGFANVRTGTTIWRVYSVQLPGRTIQVAQPMEVRLALARSHALRTLLPVLVLLPVLAAALWYGARRALAPMATLARELRERDLKLLAPMPEDRRPDELQPLVKALNDLLRRLRAASNAQRTFVADAAHELRSPLTAIKLQAQLLDRSADPESRANASARLGAGIERASHLVDQLLTLARSEPDTPQGTPVATQLEEIVRLAAADVVPLAQARGVDLGVTVADAVRVEGDPEALRVLARNLVDNAVRYTPSGGRVDARVARRADHAILEVEDTGPGIPASERERVFARFTRGPHDDEAGSGLGLAIVRTIAERHGGRIELDDAPGGGLLARAVLPLRAA